MNIEIIPAILSDSIVDIREKLSKLKGVSDWVQIDVVDGEFAQNRTWPYVGDDGSWDKILRREEKFPFAEDFNFEIDLMVESPSSVIHTLVDAGAKRVIIHLSSVSHDEPFEMIREWSNVVEMGIAILPGTPIEEISAYVDKVSFVQCMGIAKVGFQGQPFDSRTINTIREIKSQYPDFTVSVDGAVSKDTAPELIKAGANRLAVGSAIVKNDDPVSAIKYFESL